ncbi:hypothetical protein BDZ89DRAFT_1055255 [Hymenopellis radicata]|nr:hypothetical protein BDZ89DRAFT_1055255 [Hymenopellis radicata]
MRRHDCKLLAGTSNITPQVLIPYVCKHDTAIPSSTVEKSSSSSLARYTPQTGSARASVGLVGKDAAMSTGGQRCVATYKIATTIPYLEWRRSSLDRPRQVGITGARARKLCQSRLPGYFGVVHGVRAAQRWALSNGLLASMNRRMHLTSTRRRDQRPRLVLAATSDANLPNPYGASIMLGFVCESDAGHRLLRHQGSNSSPQQEEQHDCHDDDDGIPPCYDKDSTLRRGLCTTTTTMTML